MSEIKLKPCPFCGGEATLRKSELAGLYHIACFECGCRQDASYKKETVIKAWNTRKPMERIVEQLEADRNELQEIIGSGARDIYKNTNFGYLTAINKAIKIVQKGGAE